MENGARCEMKEIWIAVYNKPLSDDNPLDTEAHGFEVEAENTEQALELLNQRLDSSWSNYFFGVVKREEFDALVCDLDQYDIPVYVHPLQECSAQPIAVLD